MSAFTFGPRSLLHLEGINEDLEDVAHHAIILSTVDFAVIEGLRTAGRQAQLVAEGASQTLQSKHIIGHAIDIAAMVGGAISWDYPLYPVIAQAFQQASRDLSIPLRWGGVWDVDLADLSDNLALEVENYKARKHGKAFIDAGHFELHFPTGTTA